MTAFIKKWMVIFAFYLVFYQPLITNKYKKHYLVYNVTFNWFKQVSIRHIIKNL